MPGCCQIRNNSGAIRRAGFVTCINAASIFCFGVTCANQGSLIFGISLSLSLASPSLFSISLLFHLFARRLSRVGPTWAEWGWISVVLAQCFFPCDGGSPVPHPHEPYRSYVRYPFASKESPHILETDDLCPTVVPGVKRWG